MSFHKDVPLVQTSGDTYYPRTTEESVWGADGERLDNKLNAYKSSIQNMEKLQTAGGTSTAITLTGVKLESGFTITFIVRNNNNGNPTTINGKYLYKHGTTTSPKLVAGKAVTIWYNGTHFFIKASAEGNAIADNVLAGKTFSNDDDTGLVGTMATNISVDASKASLNGATLTAGDMFTTYSSNSMVGAFDFTLPTGYYKGPKRLHIPELLATNIKAGTKVGNQNGANGFVTGTFTSDANATAGNILNGKTAYVNGAKVTGNIPSKAAATFTPSTSNQTISAGQYLSGAQTILGDADLISANILSGKNIFGIPGKSTVVDVSDTTILSNAEVLSPRYFYGTNGAKYQGTMPSKAAATITPSTSNQTISAGQYLSGTQTIAGDADLIPANILSGKNIFGVAGTLEENNPIGKIWSSLITTPISGTNYSVQAIANVNGIAIAVGSGGMIARSTDNGASWGSLITNPFGTNFIYAIANVNGIAIAVGNDGKIARSTDNGASWGSLITNPFGTSFIRAIANVNGVAIAGGLGGKIACSTNNGASWGSLITNPFNTSNSIRAIANVNGVAIAGGDDGEIARSTDNGASWSLLITNPFGTSNIEAIANVNGIAIAVGSGGKIARSTNNGASWGSLITNPFGTSIIQTIANVNGIAIAVGSGGMIARSTDNGASWGSLITNPFGTSDIRAIANVNGVAIAGGASSSGGRVARSTGN